MPFDFWCKLAALLVDGVGAVMALLFTLPSLVDGAGAGAALAWHFFV